MESPQKQGFSTAAWNQEFPSFLPKGSKYTDKQMTCSIILSSVIKILKQLLRYRSEMNLNVDQGR